MKNLPKILVSSCLLGEIVRYDGKACLVSHPKLDLWIKRKQVVSFCPEIAGGLPVPRARAAIHGKNTGVGVLNGEARIVNSDKTDVTQVYLSGARRALFVARQYGICAAILKENSPSCGTHYVFSPDFSSLICGQGSTAAYLARHGINVFSENEIDDALTFVEKSGC